MLSRVSDPKFVVPNHTALNRMWDVYFWVDDADALHGELTERGATINHELHDTDYGCREFEIRDLDGYHITFGQDLEAGGHEA